MLARKDARRRIRDPVPRRRRRVPFRNRGLRRPRAAGHDLSRALRRDLAARPADLRARCGRPMRSGIRSSSPIATCGRGRTCWSSSRRGSSFRRSRKRDGTRKFADYRDFIVNYEKLPGIGFLAGWRGEDGESPLRGEPNPKQWEKYIENQSFFTYPWPENMRYYRFANKDYLEFAEKHALFGTPPVQVDPADVFGAAAEVSPRRAGALRRAAADVAGRPRAAGDVLRSAAVLVRAARRRAAQATRSVADDYPLHAITQRPMMMYHSWDAQNAWLRQIIAREPSVHESRHRARTRTRRRRLGVGRIASRPHPLPAQDDGRRARRTRSGRGTPSASRRARGA